MSRAVHSGRWIGEATCSKLEANAVVLVDGKDAAEQHAEQLAVAH